jgi:hypothetical protein
VRIPPWNGRPDNFRNDPPVSPTPLQPIDAAIDVWLMSTSRTRARRSSCMIMEKKCARNIASNCVQLRSWAIVATQFYVERFCMFAAQSALALSIDEKSDVVSLRALATLCTIAFEDSNAPRKS